MRKYSKHPHPNAVDMKSQLTIDLEEPFLLLHVLRNINLVHGVVQTKFLEKNVDLLAVWCASGVANIASFSSPTLFQLLEYTYRSISVVGAMIMDLKRPNYIPAMRSLRSWVRRSGA